MSGNRVVDAEDDVAVGAAGLGADETGKEQSKPLRLGMLNTTITTHWVITGD